MLEVVFSTQEKEVLTQKIQKYMSEELEREIGTFDAEFLLEFFSKEMGAYFYNRGLADAKIILEKKLELITEAIYEIEKPTEFSK
jgi:uncharacterized protein (DUF2164 family)